ncbi:putative adenylate cyclase [Mycobacterium xenopi 4042]|uniref:Putative adenylate cyclase n=1 Tax=Mycobacterium xenopi 4042 TaxID=1299334 RepID=X7ZWQ2_MYCXE|nr:putative adenylate cyclase [Mycobacterium xenopi 4042]
MIVETVGRHGGFVNKFQGDAALAIFGAPIEHPTLPAARWRPRANYTTRCCRCWVRWSSGSGSRPAARSPATSARRPASNTP